MFFCAPMAYVATKKLYNFFITCCQHSRSTSLPVCNLLVILGDMNGRIANENDFIENNEENSNDDYLPIPKYLNYDNPLKREIH